MKWLLTLSFTVATLASLCQSFPSNPTQGNPSTKNVVLGAWEARKGMIVGVYSDTSSANSDTYTKGVPYITITTTSGGNVLWQRNSTATQWVQMSGGGGGGVPVTRIWLDSLRRAVGTDSIYEYFSSYAGVEGRRFAFKTSEAGGSDSTAYVNGLVVNDSTLRLYRFNGDSSDFVIKGNGIPITGTNPASGPVTGDIEIDASSNRKIYAGTAQLLFDDELSVKLKNGNGDDDITVNVGSSQVDLIATNSTSGFTSTISVTPFLMGISSTDPASRGFAGDQDFTANITDLDYTQKKYVDSVAALGGTTIDETIVATGGQTAFTFTSVPADYANYLIFINGAEIENTTYFTTSGNIVTFTAGLVAGDRVRYRRIK